MSLKAFHLFFIAVSVLFTGGLGAWILSADGSPGFAWGSIASSLVMLVYGITFVKKAKSIIT